MGKYINDECLGYFWNKIKAWALATFSRTTHYHPASNINSLTGYSKASSPGASISVTDTLNQALGKMEATVESMQPSNSVFGRGKGSAGVPVYTDAYGNVTPCVSPLSVSITGNCSGSSTSCTGNSATATKLQTARDINICDADGSHTGTKISFNGTENAVIKLPSTIKATLQGNVTGNVSGSSTSCTGNSATATKFASAQSVTLTGAVTGTASSQAGWNVGTIWRSCMVGQSGSTNTNPWYKVATFTVANANDDIIATFLVDDTYSSHKQGILKVHVRTDGSKVVAAGATELTWLTHTGFAVTDFVLVCPTSASPTVELWTRIATGYMFRRFTVLSEGSRTGTSIRWTLLNASSAGQVESIPTAGTQIASKLSGQAASAGSTTGNSATATKATQDGDGKVISSTYLKLAGGKMTGDLKLTTGTGNQLRLINGNYGVIFRNDGSNFYTLLTASGAAENGSWNSLRPLTINLSTGVCNISGNAATATTLATARNFYVADNSATNTGPATSFNGSANATIKLPATIKANITGNCSGSSGSCTGNAASATKATNDSDGKKISTTYLKLTGGTMSGAITIKPSGPGIKLCNNVVTKGTKPSSNTWTYLEILDNANGRLGWIGNSYNTSNVTTMGLYCRKQDATTETSIGCGFDANKAAYTWAPTPAAGDNSTKIATTAWARAATGNFACNAASATKLATARTINGVSFNGTANITITTGTTPSAGDSSTKLATTAFVHNMFHFSTSAPSNSTGANGDLWYQYV